MKKRLTALALAGVLVFALSACGGDSGDATPTPSAPESLSPSPTPDESAAPSLEASPSAEVEESLEPTGAPESETPAPSATSAPSLEPAAGPSDGTVQSHPIETPAPSETPAKAVTAADVYAAVSAAAGVSYDDTSAYIENFYTTLDTAALSDYVLYMPAMSSQLEEIFLAKVTGDMEAVKSACLDRQAAMAEEAEFYGTTGAYVDAYQLVTEGDWVLFCVGEKAADAVSAFQDAVK